jgi:hypothetical protein
MDKTKNNPVENKANNKENRYPYEFVILIGSLFIGGIILILKMVGIF